MVALPIEDVVSCLGFSKSSSPLSQARLYTKVLDAMAHLAEQRKPDSITSVQKKAAEDLMLLMASEDPEEIGAAEAAAQVMAMVAADDTKNPHLMHVEKWVTLCCQMLNRLRVPATAEHPHPSEKILVCVTSCLAELMNNPRSTIVCTTKAKQILQAVQLVLLLPRVHNRMLYFQACRTLSEVLHPSTWPMDEVAHVPRKVLRQLEALLRSTNPEGVSYPEENKDTTKTAEEDAQELDAELVGAGEEEQQLSGVVRDIGQENLIHMQTSKAILVMATNGAADLIVHNAPGIIPALEYLRMQKQGEGEEGEEVVLQADAAIMSLWLSSDGFSQSKEELRPIVAHNLLRSLGSVELEDNHQDASLALVTSTMASDSFMRQELLSLYASILKASPELLPILIGHVADTESLAHQSIVYFVLHLTENEDCADCLTASASNAETLVQALLDASETESHAAPLMVLSSLVEHAASRPRTLAHLTDKTLRKHRNVAGSSSKREVDHLLEVMALTDSATQPSPRSPITKTLSYLTSPKGQAEFIRNIFTNKPRNASLRRSRSNRSFKEGEEPAESEGVEGEAQPASLPRSNTSANSPAVAESETGEPVVAPLPPTPPLKENKGSAQ